ncbi:MAG: DUF1501 domain-containing protein, partial [Caldimonas sp.]
MNPSFDPKRRMMIGAALTAGASSAWSALSLAASGNRSGRRFVLVVLRGGMDGLSAVPAIGDPDFAAARGPLGRYATPALALDGPFALHPNLAALHAMYRRGELAVVHAVGLQYRERSHFDAQQVLESGGTRPYELTTGWLGRALGDGGTKGIALNTAVPLVLRGRAVVDTWAPSALPDPSADLVARIGRMYERDSALATALERAKALHLDGGGMSDAASAMGSSVTGSNTSNSDTMSPDGIRSTAMGSTAMGSTAHAAALPGAGGSLRGAGNFALLARRAAEFLVQPDGPQAAVLELGGWDTHANQANPNGALAIYLRQLDNGLAALRDGLAAGDTWKRTAVVIASEFGREVAINGTLGTDHGTGGV